MCYLHLTHPSAHTTGAVGSRHCGAVAPGEQLDCVYRQWFMEVFLGPFSNVNDRIMPMSYAMSSEVPKTMGIQQKSSALSLTYRYFSRFSESFDDVMRCR